MEIPQYILDKLDPEIREKYDKGELSQDQLLQFLNNADDLADGDEEGEFDFDDEEGEQDHAGCEDGKEEGDSEAGVAKTSLIFLGELIIFSTGFPPINFLEFS